MEVARPVRRAGRGHPPAEKQEGRPGPTLPSTGNQATPTAPDGHGEVLSLIQPRACSQRRNDPTSARRLFHGLRPSVSPAVLEDAAYPLGRELLEGQVDTAIPNDGSADAGVAASPVGGQRFGR